MNENRRGLRYYTRKDEGLPKPEPVPVCTEPGKCKHGMQLGSLCLKCRNERRWKAHKTANKRLLDPVVGRVLS